MLPMCESWILVRSKTKDKDGKTYYGSYPGGFLERVRNVFLNGNRDASIWHICSGFAHHYNVDKLWGFGINDIRLDIDEQTDPDILIDVRFIKDRLVLNDDHVFDKETKKKYRKPDLLLIDRPYGEIEAQNYRYSDVCPNLNQLVKDCFILAENKCPVLCIDYYWPSPGMSFQEYAAVSVLTGRNNKARVLTAWRRKVTDESLP